ncbi:uncharacterized protein LOC120846643 [Ixodes scapularis]|uniref:uncharacterized protein LOC120846643 n=1 Tax=Ixodes scapularis TaxID=6945 RepID=UPI001A9E3F7D|nr:uncharacterized protein LOC120846643 [Ixodes scapularis]
MLQNVGSLLTCLLLIVNAASTDPSSDETSVCQNVLVPAGFKNIPSSEQDAWSFVAAPGDFMYVLYRNFHSDRQNKGTNKCVMVQKVPYDDTAETRFANYTKWYNETTCLSYAMQSFYKLVMLDGSKGTTKNVLAARHKVGGIFTNTTCYPFAYTNAKCAVVLMNHWNHAAKNQCKEETPNQEDGTEKITATTGKQGPCETACEMWVRHENLNETSLSENCTKYYKQFCGETKIFLYDKPICDQVEKLPINITNSYSKDE